MSGNKEPGSRQWNRAWGREYPKNHRPRGSGERPPARGTLGKKGR